MICLYFITYLPNVQEAPAQLHILSSRTIHEEEKGLTFRQDDLWKYGQMSYKAPKWSTAEPAKEMHHCINTWKIGVVSLTKSCHRMCCNQVVLHAKFSQFPHWQHNSLASTSTVGNFLPTRKNIGWGKRSVPLHHLPKACQFGSIQIQVHQSACWSWPGY